MKSYANIFANFLGKSGPLSERQNSIAEPGSVFSLRFCFMTDLNHNLMMPVTCDVEEIIHSQQYLPHCSTIMNVIVAPLSVGILCGPVQAEVTRCNGLVDFDVGWDVSRVCDAACDVPSRQALQAGCSS